MFKDLDMFVADKASNESGHSDNNILSNIKEHIDGWEDEKRIYGDTGYMFQENPDDNISS